jgi:hypothetical protein
MKRKRLLITLAVGVAGAVVAIAVFTPRPMQVLGEDGDEIHG